MAVWQHGKAVLDFENALPSCRHASCALNLRCGPVGPSRSTSHDEPTVSAAAERIQYLIQCAWRYPCAYDRSVAIDFRSRPQACLMPPASTIAPLPRGLRLTVMNSANRCMWPWLTRGNIGPLLQLLMQDCYTLNFSLVDNSCAAVPSSSCQPFGLSARAVSEQPFAALQSALRKLDVRSIQVSIRYPLSGEIELPIKPIMASSLEQSPALSLAKAIEPASTTSQCSLYSESNLPIRWVTCCQGHRSWSLRLFHSRCSAQAAAGEFF